MKSLTKVFITLLLAVMLNLGIFNPHANSSTISSVDHYQVTSSSNLQPEILPNETIEIPLGTITYTKGVLIVNKTKCLLRRVGVYKKSLEWTIGDVTPLRAVGEQFNDDAFSFASNYQINCGTDKEKRNVQLASELTSTGERKINIGVINQNGIQPAKITWDDMKNSDDKSLKNSPFEVHAYIKQRDTTFFWIYEVTEQS
jgi:hypothetical protein